MEVTISATERRPVRQKTGFPFFIEEKIQRMANKRSVKHRFKSDLNPKLSKFVTFKKFKV